MDINGLIKEKQARHIIMIYAIVAATISAITAIDPEPLSGTALMIFADTPLVTVITTTMIIHLALLYNQKDVLQDGLIIAVALAGGTVMGALGAKILGRLVPVLGSFNNAIITFSLHYATGRVITDYFSKGYNLTDLDLKMLKTGSEQYKEEGNAQAKKCIETFRKMSSEDKACIKKLTKEYRAVGKEMENCIKQNESEQIEILTERLFDIGSKIEAVYMKYGLNMD